MVFRLKQYCPWFYNTHYWRVVSVCLEQVSVSSLSPRLQPPGSSDDATRTVPQQASQPAGHRHQVTHENIVRAFRHSWDSEHNMKPNVTAPMLTCVHNRQVIVRILTITLKYAAYNVIQQCCWTKINVCHVSAILKHVTVSFPSMKSSRLYLQWMQFPQTLYVWILMWKRWFVFSQEIFVRHKCLVCFMCVHMYLLVLITEVKNVMYMNSVAMGQINQCWFQYDVVYL